MADVGVHVDEANVELKGATPGINMPDHPIRRHWLYQSFERLWRPTAGWVTVAGLFYAFIYGPAVGKPLAEGYLVQVLLFAGGVLGLKSWEKAKGVA